MLAALMIDNNKTAKPAIAMYNLSKLYKLGLTSKTSSEYSSLREDLAADLTKVFKIFLSWIKKSSSKGKFADKEEFWALKDISLEIMPGERVGVIGRNGAGKSTLLKLLSRITDPTDGRIEIRGQVASLLEVGTGFHPELTGRENIYLNGAILGMTRKEVARKFDEIVKFAEVERFLDTPVKHYSSGMYVRLAFAVAAHLDPEILIVDEVLAVGDAQFQKKCLGKMEDVSSQEGRTVIFVSHNMGAIRAICTKCIWLEGGMVRSFGPTSDVISQYLSSVHDRENVFSSTDLEGDFRFSSVVIRNSVGEETNLIGPSEDFVVEIHYLTRTPIESPSFWIDISGAYGHLFTASMIFDNLTPGLIDGKGMISCRFKAPLLLPQTYSVNLRIRDSQGGDTLSRPVFDAAFFQVTGGAKEYRMEGPSASNYLDHDTPIILPYEWIYNDGTRAEPVWQK